MERVPYFTQLSPIKDASQMHVFGTARAVTGPVEMLPQPKTGRKNAQVIEALQSRGVITSGLTIENRALQYTTSGIGDPGFTFSYMSDSEGRGWYLHARALYADEEGVYADVSMVIKDTEVSNDNTQIIAGTCLFGATSVDAMTSRGEVRHITDAADVKDIADTIVSLSVADALHPYEVETSLRLTNFFHFLPEVNEGKIYFHIPSIEYKLFGWDLYQRGLLDQNLLEEWFVQVDKRAEHIQNIIEQRIPRHSSLNLVQPLQPLSEMWDTLLSLPPDEAMQRTAEYLASQDSVWKYIISLWGEPENPVALSQYSYQVGYLQVAKNGKLTIAAENPNEVRIFDSVKNTLKKGKETGSPNQIGDRLKLVGLYVHPNTNVPPGGGLRGRSHMLYTSQRPSLALTKEIVQTHSNLAPQNGVVYKI